MPEGELRDETAVEEDVRYEDENQGAQNVYERKQRHYNRPLIFFKIKEYPGRERN